MRKIVLVLIIVIIVIVGVALAWRYWLRLPTTGNWETYQDNQLGFKINYPAEMFNVSESPSGVSLLSAYSITDNPSGIPGKEAVHVFSINFELKRTDILKAIETESSYAFSQIFPDGTMQNFQVIDGFSDHFNSANRDGFSYLSGAEGLFIRYVFLPRNSNETLVVKFNHFDNSIFGSIPPDAGGISFEKQNEIFDTVMATLDFLD